MNIFETLGPKLRKAILLTESNRAMREMLKGNIHPMALKRKGMLRPAEQMERGYLKGIENKRAKHGIRDLDYAEQHAMGLPYNKPGYAVNRQSLADHTTDADTPKRARKATRKFLRNNPNDKGWTHTLPGNESVVRGHETDELLSKAKNRATIKLRGRIRAGNHAGLDVLGKEMQDTARLKAHGSKMGDSSIVVHPEHTIAKKDNTLKVIPERSMSLQGERHKTGEYDLVRRKAGMDPKSSFVGPQEMRKLRNARHDMPGAFISQPPERPVINAPMARKAAKMKRRQLRMVSKGLASKYGDKFMKVRGDKPNYVNRFKGKAAPMMTNKTFGNIPESMVTRAGNLQEANKAVKLLRQIDNGRKDLDIEGLRDAAKNYYDPDLGRKGLKGISKGTKRWVRSKIKSPKEARKAGARFTRAMAGMSYISPKSSDITHAQSAAFYQERKLGAHDRKELAPERSMTKARALATRMSPQSMEMHAKRAGVSLSDAGSQANSPAKGAFYRHYDRHVHVPDGLLPEFVHEGGIKGGGHHYIDTSKQARVAASTPRDTTFDDELAASTTGIKAARRVGLKVTQADARYLTKALGTYAGGGRYNKERDRFVELARKGVFRKLASTESIGARAGNLQEALSEKVRADIPKNKFVAPTMLRVGHEDKGLYPIFDKKSAESALKLSGRHPHLKQEIARRAAAYGVKPEKKGTRYA